MPLDDSTKHTKCGETMELERKGSSVVVQAEIHSAGFQYPGSQSTRKRWKRKRVSQSVAPADFCFSFCTCQWMLAFCRVGCMMMFAFWPSPCGPTIAIRSTLRL